MIAGVAASYSRRELDRNFYDRLLNTSAGRTLMNMDENGKRQLEFIAYCTSAYATTHKPDTGAFRQFINGVAADAPPEIARRVLNGEHKTSKEQIRESLNELTDEQFEEFICEVQAQRNENAPQAALSEELSPIAKMADRIEESARKMRDQREATKRQV